MNMPDKEWLEKTMKALDLTEQEAIEMWQDDHDIDKGKPKDFDLPVEKLKEIAKVNRGKAENKAKKERKPRKPNEEKRAIIDDLMGHLANVSWIDNFSCSNPEKEIEFFIGGTHYSLSLICHRPPKEK